LRIFNKIVKVIYIFQARKKPQNVASRCSSFNMLGAELSQNNASNVKLLSETSIFNFMLVQ
jgi:hypothetical protein